MGTVRIDVKTIVLLEERDHAHEHRDSARSLHESASEAF